MFEFKSAEISSSDVFDLKRDIRGTPSALSYYKIHGRYTTNSPHGGNGVDKVHEFAGVRLAGEEKVEAIRLLLHRRSQLVGLVLQNNLLQEEEGLLVVDLQQTSGGSVS